ncbi:MAG: hypothetical protein ACWGPS_09610 [Candidatus Promineifilaceae bacterium]
MFGGIEHNPFEGQVFGGEAEGPDAIGRVEDHPATRYVSDALLTLVLLSDETGREDCP